MRLGFLAVGLMLAAAPVAASTVNYTLDAVVSDSTGEYAIGQRITIGLAVDLASGTFTAPSVDGQVRVGGVHALAPASTMGNVFFEAIRQINNPDGGFDIREIRFDIPTDLPGGQVYDPLTALRRAIGPAVGFFGFNTLTILCDDPNDPDTCFDIRSSGRTEFRLVSAVPLPAGALLLGTALAALPALRRRRKGQSPLSRS